MSIKNSSLTCPRCERTFSNGNYNLTYKLFDLHVKHNHPELGNINFNKNDLKQSHIRINATCGKKGAEKTMEKMKHTPTYIYNHTVEIKDI